MWFKKFERKVETIELNNEKNMKIVRKYNGEYKLSNIIRNNLPWNAGQCMIKDDEDVLFSVYYRYSGDIANNEKEKEWYGNNWFLFYIVKAKEKYKIKYLDLRDTGEKAHEIAEELISNLGKYQLYEVGYRSKEYAKYIRNEKMVEVELSDEILNEIDKIKNLKYDKLDYFSYIYANEAIDYFDYINKKYFYCDEYCPEKYKPCIELMEYIIKKCKILNLNKCNIKFFKPEERDAIMQKLMDRENKKELID